MQSAISRATLGRLPAYLHFLESVTSENISAPAIARALGLGEVLVRKDLSIVCGKGKPKTGYATNALKASLKAALGVNKVTPAVLVGAGKLGTALMDYRGFRDYGMEIIAAFDKDAEKSVKRPVSPFIPWISCGGFVRCTTSKSVSSLFLPMRRNRSAINLSRAGSKPYGTFRLLC